MNRLHNIKISEEYADSVLCGDKKFEVRRNDRGYQKGDIVHFQVVDNKAKLPIEHRLNKFTFKITYVFSGFGLQEGMVVFGIAIQYDPENATEKISILDDDGEPEVTARVSSTILKKIEDREVESIEAISTDEFGVWLKDGGEE